MEKLVNVKLIKKMKIDWTEYWEESCDHDWKKISEASGPSGSVVSYRCRLCDEEKNEKFFYYKQAIRWI